jgi:hypothetical protein
MSDWLLDFTFDLIAATIDLSKIVVSELIPYLLDLAFGFFLVPFDPVPVHHPLLDLPSIANVTSVD